jgi:hypothetical protein
MYCNTLYDTHILHSHLPPPRLPPRSSGGRTCCLFCTARDKYPWNESEREREREKEREKQREKERERERETERERERERQRERERERERKDVYSRRERIRES